MKESEAINATDFGRIFMEYRDRFVKIAYSYIHDEAAAEDIVADAFTSFWDKRKEIELQGAPQAYILASVRNRCLNNLRDRANRLRIEQKMQEREMKVLNEQINALESKELDWLFSSKLKRSSQN